MPSQDIKTNTISLDIKSNPYISPLLFCCRIEENTCLDFKLNKNISLKRKVIGREIQEDLDEICGYIRDLSDKDIINVNLRFSRGHTRDMICFQILERSDSAKLEENDLSLTLFKKKFQIFCDEVMQLLNLPKQILLLDNPKPTIILGKVGLTYCSRDS